MQINKILVLCFWEFPHGMAPTTRILAYCKGLVENGIEAEIISFKRIFRNENKIKSSYGNVNNVKYYHPHYFSKVSENNYILRAINEIILRIKILFVIYKINRHKKVDYIFFSFDDYRSLRTYTRLIRFLKIPIIFVADEYPIPIRDFNYKYVPTYYLNKYKKYHACIKARILMTNALKIFYDTNISVKPTFILNSIIDTTRFENTKEINCEKKYICYMGNLGLEKDNVDNIIKAFALIRMKIENVELHLYGEPTFVDRQKLMEIIKINDLEKFVIFKGRATFDEIPAILKGAYILVASQPKTKRAEGGFPTKLAEYLVSGKPSIFTDVGEIAKYIIDGENAFLVMPENHELYANKIIFIHENYEYALEVGERGRKYILENYSANKVTKELKKFMENNL